MKKGLDAAISDLNLFTNHLNKRNFISYWLAFVVIEIEVRPAFKFLEQIKENKE